MVFYLIQFFKIMFMSFCILPGRLRFQNLFVQNSQLGGGWTYALETNFCILTNVTQTFKIPFFTKTEINFIFFRLSDGYQNVDIFDGYLNVTAFQIKNIHPKISMHLEFVVKFSIFRLRISGSYSIKDIIVNFKFRLNLDFFN